MKDPKKILVLFDVSTSYPPDEDFSQDFKHEDWATEGDVVKALRKLGFDVRHMSLYNDLAALHGYLATEKPDIIFNLAETFQNERSHEPNVAAFLELSGIPYTGASPIGLILCKNKGLTKEVLTYHRIRVPRFVISHHDQPTRKLRHFTYPAFIKPLGLEGSDGISQDSFANNEEDCLARIQFVHERLGKNAIIEEYIEGRELYVSVMGNNRPRVFPPRELHFTKVPEGTPKFATYQAKWNNAYRKRWGIRSGPAKQIDEDVLRKIERTCRRAYKALRIRGYARIDIRLRPNNEIVIIEANPNPTLASWEDFALSAKAGEVSYEELIDKIVHLAINHH